MKIKKLNSLAIVAALSLGSLALSGCVMMPAPPDAYMIEIPAKMWQLKVNYAQTPCSDYHIFWSYSPLLTPFGQGCDPTTYTYDGNILPNHYLNVSFNDKEGEQILMTFDMDKAIGNRPLVYGSVIVRVDTKIRIVSLIYKEANLNRKIVTSSGVFYDNKADVIIAQRSY
jgi:hypothetical protein